MVDAHQVIWGRESLAGGFGDARATAECRAVCALGCHSRLRDGYAEACFVFGGAAAVFDALVALVFRQSSVTTTLPALALPFST